MPAMSRRLRYQVAVSLDGFIAGPNGEYDWIVMDSAIDFAALHINTQGVPVRDLWAHRRVRVQDNKYTVTIPSHGVVMLRVGR